MDKRPSVHVQKVAEYTGHKGSIFSLVLDQDERYAYTAGDDGMVACWDLKGPEDMGQGVLQTDASIYALALIPSHGYLVAGSSNGTLYVVDLSQQQVVQTIRKTTGAIYGLHYERQRDLLWVLYAQGALSVYSMTTFTEQGYLRIANNHLRSLQTAPDGQHWFIGSSDHQIYVFRPKDGQVVQHWEAHGNSVFSLCVHESGHYLLSGGRDAYLKVWDLQQPYRLLKEIPAHNFTVNDIAMHPSGDYFVTASRDKTLKLWDAYQWELLKVIDHARHEAHVHSVNRVAWLTQDNSLLSCSDDRRLIRWQLMIST